MKKIAFLMLLMAGTAGAAEPQQVPLTMGVEHQEQFFITLPPLKKGTPRLEFIDRDKGIMRYELTREELRTLRDQANAALGETPTMPCGSFSVGGTITPVRVPADYSSPALMHFMEPELSIKQTETENGKSKR